jgi:hypothetical protein
MTDAASLYRLLLDMGVHTEIIDTFIYRFGAVEGCNRLIDVLREESE